MRLIVYGVGAIGGTIAVAAAAAGMEVIGIARGAQLSAIRAGGLTLRTPAGDRQARFDCAAHPGEIPFRPDDSILLCMKTQDTHAALQALDAAGVTTQPMFCAQNGVENERLAARMFPNVHGITVMLPAQFLQPGEIVAQGTPCHGIFDIGRYPVGTDADDDTLAAALTEAGIQSFPDAAVMAGKYGKLLLNLGNGVEAALGRGVEDQDIRDALRAEAKAVLEAAGIAWRAVGLDDPRRAAFLRIGEVAGQTRAGSSTSQSLMRGAGSVETDYLNGEIALLGQLHGCPAPMNAAVAALVRKLAREGKPPGSVAPDMLRNALGL